MVKAATREDGKGRGSEHNHTSLLSLITRVKVRRARDETQGRRGGTRPVRRQKGRGGKAAPRSVQGEKWARLFRRGMFRAARGVYEWGLSTRGSARSDGRNDARIDAPNAIDTRPAASQTTRGV